MNGPDPGHGYRLVTDYNEDPHPMAEMWLEDDWWVRRDIVRRPYEQSDFYRIPLSRTQDSSAAVVVWIVGALVFLTGFLIGWSL